MPTSATRPPKQTKTPEGDPSGAEGFRLSCASLWTGEGVTRRERPKNSCVKSLILRDHFLLVAVAGGDFVGGEDAVTGREG